MKRLSVTAVLLCFVATVFAQELNVGSVNIRYGAKGDYKKHNGWVERRDYMCSLLNHERFDIFGAQEVLKSQLDDMLERMPEYGYVGVARDDGAEKGEFSPIFYNKSRVKMLKSGTFWLSETPEEVSKGWDGLCRRVCTWGLFQDKITKAKFYHFNTHLDHRGKVAQVEGAKLILAKIAELCPRARISSLRATLMLCRAVRPIMCLRSRDNSKIATRRPSIVSHRRVLSMALTLRATPRHASTISSLPRV